MSKKPVRVLINMTSQVAGKPTGVSRGTFCLLREWVKTPDMEFVLRSAWSRDELPSDLQDSALEVMTIPRPHRMTFHTFHQAVVMPSVIRTARAVLLVNADPFGSPTGCRARMTIVHDFYHRAIRDRVPLRARLTNGSAFFVVLHSSSRIMCISNATRADLTRAFPALTSRSVVVHWASTLGAPSADSSTNPVKAKEPYILVVGNDGINKNFELVGRAFDRLHRSGYRQVSLVHVGQDDRKAIASVLTETSARNAVVRLERIEDAELGAIFANALCLCVPSLYEGFCLPILEAQQRDCPVVTTNVSVMPEIAGDGALYVHPDRPDELAQAVTTLLVDRNIRQALVEKGRENVSRFSWHKAAGSYLDHMRELVGSAT
jgi:glycosyltransferase involved in cell wall biosynthesis